MLVHWVFWGVKLKNEKRKDFGRLSVHNTSQRYRVSKERKRDEAAQRYNSKKLCFFPSDRAHLLRDELFCVQVLAYHGFVIY